MDENLIGFSGFVNKSGSGNFTEDQRNMIVNVLCCTWPNKYFGSIPCTS